MNELIYLFIYELEKVWKTNVEMIRGDSVGHKRSIQESSKFNPRVEAH